MNRLVRVTFIWFGGCFSPHGGEEGPAAMVVAQCRIVKKAGNTVRSCHSQRGASDHCPTTLVWEASSLMGELQLRLLSFPVLRDINCAQAMDPVLLWICKLGFAGNRRRVEVQRGGRSSPGPHS